MAKTPVTFTAQGIKDREVMMFTYSFDQQTDREGQMSGIPRGGKITVRVKAHNSGERDLVEWMLVQDQHKDGSIIVKKSGDIANTQREIQFVDAYCISYQEYWEDVASKSEDAAPNHFEEFVLSCREITVSGNGDAVTYTNNWE